MQTRDHLQEFIADPGRRRTYEREALAFEASELVSRLMEDQGVSKTELATRLGTSKSHITNLLAGSRNMTMHTLADLAFVLGHKIQLAPMPLDAVASKATYRAKLVGVGLTTSSRTAFRKVRSEARRASTAHSLVAKRAK